MKYSIVKLRLFSNRIPIVILDTFGLIFVFWLSWSLKAGNFISFPQLNSSIFVLIPIVSIPIFTRYGLYRAVVRYIGYRALWTIFQATGTSTLALALLTYLLGIHDIPRSTFMIYWMATMIYVDGTRLFVRWRIAQMRLIPGDKGHPVVIFGAGDAGKKIVKALAKSPRLTPIAFIDDQKELAGEFVADLRVYARQQLPILIDNYGVDEVLLALPSIGAHERQEIIQWLEGFPVHVRTLPSLMEIHDGKVAIQDIREIGLDDLLGRDPVPPIKGLLKRCIHGENVMIYGAGGSIGSELCRQALQQKPKCLILYDISEFALYSIEKELKPFALNNGIELIAALGNINNTQRVSQFIQKYKINTIYHAAAYKHVPLVEFNIIEGIQNNIFGTLNVAQIAAKYRVKNFVLISTDKAVRPTNMMGASKRIAEMILQAFQQKYTHTTFTMVRFGNVLGSSGSVIPLFWEQINSGGPVTVTHRDINRYFMTIPEAASLVIQAGAMGQGGDVFVLNMGEPVKIYDLAIRMIRLSGLNVEQDIQNDIENTQPDIQNPTNTIKIQISGLRPGEKLYEELMIENNVTGTEHPKIMRADDQIMPWSELKVELEQIQEAVATHHIEQVFDVFLKIVDGFHHNGKIVDYLDSPSTPIKMNNNTVVALKSF